jgi:hypothetical protein
MVQSLQALQQQVATIQPLQQQLAVLQQQQQLQQPPPSRNKPARPDSYHGVGHKGPKIEEWIFKMEQYFALMQVPGDQQVTYASTLLTGDALEWFRLQRARAANNIPYATWRALVTAMRQQFSVINQAKQARDRLASLHQHTSAQRYAADFISLCLLIPGISEDEQLDRFVRGLKPAIRKEVELKSPATFKEAVSLAERIDSLPYKGSYSSTPVKPPYRASSNSGPTPMELGTMETRQNNNRDSGRSRYPKLTAAERQHLRNINGCYYCRKPGHLIQDCPDRPYKAPPTGSEGPGGAGGGGGAFCCCGCLAPLVPGKPLARRTLPASSSSDAGTPRKLTLALVTLCPGLVLACSIQ